MCEQCDRLEAAVERDEQKSTRYVLIRPKMGGSGAGFAVFVGAEAAWDQLEHGQGIKTLIWQKQEKL